LDNIYNLNKEQVKSFLIGVINGDGCISNRKSGGIVSITCGSIRTAESLQKLFYKLGIISKVNLYKALGGGVVTKRESTLFRTVITGNENIIKLKDNRLIENKIINIYNISNRKNNSFPFHKIDLLLNEISLNLPKNKKSLLYQNSIRKHKDMKNISFKKETLKNALNKIDDNHDLKKIVNAGSYLSKIVSIKNIKPQEVYNLQTDSKFEPNYFANFVPVHNCMIDELDKMSEDDRSAMHEALEGQTITISKANIQATLRAETTVLAAANPKFGRFDPYDSISKQIDLPPALINRFDLIFAIKDVPDRDKDEKMASFILGLHMDPKGKESEIPTELIRKYIAYAKQNIKPLLTEGAVEEIKNYYIKMRHKGSTEGEIRSIPISARQLEGLVRIAEACAKIRLSKKVSRKDARVAVDLLHYALTQIGVDPETGEIDIDRIATGISSSERNKIVNVREIISKLEESLGRTIPIEEIIRSALEKGMSEDKVEEAIEKLKKSGDLFEPRRGFISRI
jgi:replicative DNA helicase Mcm